MTRIADFMSGDHHRLDGIFEEFEKSKSLPLFKTFREGLERHIGWEEDILFPLVDREAGSPNPMTEELRLQHRTAKQYMAQIESSIGDNQALQRLEDALRLLLDAHDKMEEETLYPWIDRYISAGDLDDAFKRMGGK